VAIHLGMRSEPVNAFYHSCGCQRGQRMASALVDPSQTQRILPGDQTGLALDSIADLTHNLIMRVDTGFSKSGSQHPPAASGASSGLSLPIPRKAAKPRHHRLKTQ